MAALAQIVPAAEGARDGVLGITRDPALKAALAEAARQSGLPDAGAVDWEAPEVLRLVRRAAPKVLVLDVGAGERAVADLERLAEACPAETPVIAVGTANDVNLFRALREGGVDDYLVKPVDASALGEAVRRLAKRARGPEPEGAPSGAMLAVIGARGGVGATTVAVNTAWLLAVEMGRKVALVDLDLYYGTVAFALDVEPGKGFRGALENPTRIDGLFMERAMVRAADNLFVLCAEEEIGNPLRFDPTAMGVLVGKLREEFDCVVIDLPRWTVPHASELAAATAVAVVSDPTLAGMRDSVRLIDYLGRAAPKAAAKLVLDQVGAGKRGELKPTEFARAAGRAIDCAVPFDAKTAARAAGAGKAAAALARRGKIAVALRPFARVIVPAAVERPSFWRRLTGGGRS